MSRFIRFALFAGALGMLATTTLAAPRVETDPNKDYLCTPEVGAWVICVHEFRGEDASNLAHQMAVQIRQRDNLPAYVFCFSDEERKRIQEEWAHSNKREPDGSPRKVKVRIPDEYAVFIGGFRDQDAATAALKAVKQLKPPQLNLPGKTTFDTISVVKFDAKGDGEMKSAPMNPFPNSFVAPNPTSAQHREVPKVDPILKTLNAEEDYSLLKNPRPWTLAVKEYVGDTKVTSRSESTSFLDLNFFKKSGETLDATAMQAHELAKVLRTPVSEAMPCFGFDAYVLHTRRSSIVAVGGFTGPDDPEMQKTAEKILKLQLRTGNPRMPQIALFAVPMEVPRP